jgi:hypothetical protein
LPSPRHFAGKTKLAAGRNWIPLRIPYSLPVSAARFFGQRLAEGQRTWRQSLLYQFQTET